MAEKLEAQFRQRSLRLGQHRKGQRLQLAHELSHRLSRHSAWVIVQVQFQTRPGKDLERQGMGELLEATDELDLKPALPCLVPPASRVVLAGEEMIEQVCPSSSLIG